MRVVGSRAARSKHIADMACMDCLYVASHRVLSRASTASHLTSRAPMPIRLSGIAALAYAAIYFLLASVMEAEYVRHSLRSVLTPILATL